MSSKQKETELGERKVSKMNFSYIITLPKRFVQNNQNGKITRVVKIIILEDGSLKITPVHEKDEPTEFAIM